LNKVRYIVKAIMGDAKKVIVEKLRDVADRVLMPLPEKAYGYLDYALMALKPEGGTVHYYDFVHAGKEEDPVEKVKLKFSKKSLKLGASSRCLEGRIVRTVGPRWYQVVLDAEIGAKI
jgi:tRNA (guanine37-N1)-methyltransferase